MCVKLVKDNQTVAYDCEKPILEQVEGCTEIIVQYMPKDKEIKNFLQQMTKCAQVGANPSVKVTVEYGNFLDGFKTKKQILKALNDISLNEIVKLLALLQHRLDKSLEEISEICTNR